MPPRTIAPLVLTPDEQELQTKRDAAAVAKAEHAADAASKNRNNVKRDEILDHLLARMAALEAEIEKLLARG